MGSFWVGVIATSIALGVVWSLMMKKELTILGTALFPLIWPVFVVLWLGANFIMCVMTVMWLVVRALMWLVFTDARRKKFLANTKSN